jgi:hypothetical protein
MAGGLRDRHDLSGASDSEEGTPCYIPGAPLDGAEGVSCAKPATKQIKIICTTGHDPGAAVNATP